MSEVDVSICEQSAGRRNETAESAGLIGAAIDNLVELGVTEEKAVSGLVTLARAEHDCFLRAAARILAGRLG
ncbi:hypothetical protein M8542_47855 [Amycolatopsis sp. OK19-0408]|uniref:Uncharacterized protein n=1 Tax=Amycolatopsis iheyensis TaxID=2945988 RepID=A0A9X2NM41_9PSEU|nr:hypothetical protein [Amycolatopsis iheyensis]MCR6490543.1 hypothetical protein [Amycolatopsis iheyensis]